MLAGALLAGAALMLIGQTLAILAMRAGPTLGRARLWDCAVVGDTVVGLGLILFAVARGVA